MTDAWQRIEAEAGELRHPPHTLDTMANIDLDYCVVVTAIAIETVADTACALTMLPARSP